MALWSTQPLTEPSWRVKGGRHLRLTTLPPFVIRLSKGNVEASTSHNLTDCYRGSFTFIFTKTEILFLTSLAIITSQKGVDSIAFVGHIQDAFQKLGVGQAVLR
jgi:hypothetical protein